MQFPGIEDIVAVGCLSVRGLFEPHLHGPDSIEITYVDTGLRCYTIDGERFLVSGGEVLVIKPGELHGIAWPYLPARVFYIKLRLPRSGDAFLNLRGAPARSLVGLLRSLSPRRFLGSARIKSCLDRLVGYRRKGLVGEAAPAMVSLLALELLREVLDCAARQRERKGPSGWAAAALEYLGEHLQPVPRIRDIAAHMGMSAPGFKSRFKRELGLTPISYLQHLRIEKARELLARQPGRSVTEIAMELGFRSSQHFATVFKRLCDETPGSFRGRLRRPGRG
jgi:AraC-like DNA-binding protein